MPPTAGTADYSVCVGSRARIAALWLWFALLTSIRFPHLLYRPDLYGEEAVYFLDGRSSPFWRSLFAVRFGYLSLVANLIGEIASTVPLPDAPLVVRVLAVVSGPAVVVAVVIAIRTSIERTALAIALVVMTPLMAAEWATAIHAQFWLVVALTLCLVLDFDSTWRIWAVRALAVFAVLSSALAAVLFVFYAWRGRRDRDRNATILAMILLIGGVIQFGLGAGREVHWAPSRFAAGLLQQNVFEALFGVWADPVGAWLRTTPMTWWLMLLTIAGLGLAIGGALWLVPRQYRLTVSAAVSVGVVGTWFAITPWLLFRFYSGERYALVGALPILVLIVLGARVDTWARVTAVVAISMSTISAGYGLGREYDNMIADRPDYWNDSLAQGDGQVQANYYCRYPLEQPPIPTTTSSVIRVDGGYRVALDRLAPLLGDPSNQVFLVAAGWGPLYDQSWQDGMWISYGAISFGGQGPDKPAYVCYTGPKDRSPSGLRVDGPAVIIPDNAIDSALLNELRPGGEPLFYVLIGPSYEQAIVRQQRIGVSLENMLDPSTLDD